MLKSMSVSYLNVNISFSRLSRNEQMETPTTMLLLQLQIYWCYVLVQMCELCIRHGSQWEC